MAKILIAEDERDIRELIEFTLTVYAGHQVFKAANGAEAVEMAPQVMPDLIMMDVRMPRMTGYEACRELKKIDAVKDIPVVFLSAKGQDTEIDSGLDAGAYDYILKPFAPDQLAARVSEILKKFEDGKSSAAAPESAAPTATPVPPVPPFTPATEPQATPLTTPQASRQTAILPALPTAAPEIAPTASPVPVPPSPPAQTTPQAPADGKPKPGPDQP